MNQEAAYVQRRPGQWPTVDRETASHAAEEARASAQLQPSNEPVTFSDAVDSWETILEEVKSRRRFAWLILSQYAQVVKFDHDSLRLKFANDASMNKYYSSGVDQLLASVIQSILNHPCQIVTIVGRAGK
ncbi:hypothetical protein [Streptomyces sp. IBSNAI001]|uniref:hypothetical protein n=1 Tax=Streptomyces sp. IBSNAI001 TaxID=3457499 RepID=UPI003FCFD7F8